MLILQVKKMLRHFSFLIPLLLLGYMATQAQSPADITVQVHATVQSAPPSITLHWPTDPNASAYAVYRKVKGVTGWGSQIGGAGAMDSTFTDSNVAVGEAWEYRLVKTATGYSGQGYCYAGIAQAAQDYLGKLILVVDTTYAAALATELRLLEEDLWGDGWQVIRMDVDRNDGVTSIRSRIQAEWAADPARLRSVFLLGHVPVPYSGNLNPDGHGDHQGAWPADAYYGEMNGGWTDQTVNNTSASRTQNHNTIGDGKFDNTAIPTDVELEVGRVDFANMPAFGLGEEALLRRYLAKDHAWRMKQFTVADSGVIDDNFGYFGGEAFAQGGWRNFAPLIGSSHAYAGDFRAELNAHGHLWAYGCGGGTYTSASGVGSTTNFVGDSLRAVFTMLFGSYHGDWDSDNNFMRAALAAKGHVLSCAWSGRPNWHFHHMGQGEPIGYSARITQNNFSTYVTGYGARWVHIGLMGDPSLRMHICAPPSSLTVTAVSGGNSHELDWTASPDAVLGYAVFRQDTLGGRFWRIGTVGMNTTTYTDSCVPPGTYRYMVRAEELRTGYSGSYHNLSQGILDTITNANVHAIQTQVFSPQVFCPGDTILVPYSTVDDFCPGNAFTAELSDSNGSFSPATVIGTASAVGSGTVACIIPQGLDPALGYRIRVNASHPVTVGSDNGADLEVLGMPTASFSIVQAGLTVTFTNTSSQASSAWWDFGDGNTSTQVSPTHTYAHDSSFTVSLIAGNACGLDTLEMNLTVVGVQEALSEAITLSPNPAQEWVEIRTQHPTLGPCSVQVVDILGARVMQTEWNGADPLRVATATWARGVYHVTLLSKAGSLHRKLVLD